MSMRRESDSIGEIRSLSMPIACSGSLNVRSTTSSPKYGASFGSGLPSPISIT